MQVEGHDPDVFCFLQQLYDTISGKSTLLDIQYLSKFGSILPKGYLQAILVKCGLLGEIHIWPEVKPFSLADNEENDQWIDIILSAIEDKYKKQCSFKLPGHLLSILEIKITSAHLSSKQNVLEKNIIPENDPGLLLRRSRVNKWIFSQAINNTNTLVNGSNSENKTNSQFTKNLFIPRTKIQPIISDSPLVIDLNITVPSIRTVARNLAWNLNTSNVTLEKAILDTKDKQLDQERQFRRRELNERKADQAQLMAIQRYQREEALKRRQFALEAKHQKDINSKHVDPMAITGNENRLINSTENGPVSPNIRKKIIQKEILAKRRRSVVIIYVDLRDLQGLSNFSNENSAMDFKDTATMDLFDIDLDSITDDPILSIVDKENDPIISTPTDQSIVKRRRSFKQCPKLDYSSTSDDSSSDVLSLYDSSSESEQENIEPVDVYLESKVLTPKTKRKSPSPMLTKLAPSIKSQINQIIDGCNLVSSRSDPSNKDVERRLQTIIDFFSGKKVEVNPENIDLFLPQPESDMDSVYLVLGEQMLKNHLLENVQYLELTLLELNLKLGHWKKMKRKILLN